MDLRPHIEDLKRRHAETEAQLSDPKVFENSQRAQALNREYSRLKEIVGSGEAWLKATADLADNRALLASEAPGSELAAMAREEVARLEAEVARLTREVQFGLVPPEPTDSRNTIFEIRAGAGGQESALFAADLFRMYSRYAEERGWKIETMDSSPSDLGGFKEIIFEVFGQDVYRRLKYESGVHRVQRVPATEAQGRIHTSTATVAVMPEVEDIDVHINPADLEVDVFRSTGSGGQSVNTTDSAVRITHKPSGLVVKCQQEKSQTKNRAQAMKMLRAKLFEIETEKQQSARDATRKSQVGTGDRSEKIRTYNFPQDRLTDHRINYTRHNLPAVMDGDVQDVIDACRTYFAAEALKEASRGEAGGGERRA